MSRKTKVITIFSLLLFWAIIPVQASEFRTLSLGGTDLVQVHLENQLNLYRATDNPAYMIQSVPPRWLKFYSRAHYGHGDLKRTYDPRAQQLLGFHFDGYKILGDRQAFWGQVEYGLPRFFSVPYAIERDPYGDDPLIIADTTVGTFNYDDLAIKVTYQYQVTPRLSLGSDLFYNISQGLKTVFTRPRILHRDFSFKLGAAYYLGRDWTWGGFVDYNTLQDQIEITRSVVDGRDPFVIRYRSERVYRERVSTFNRYYNLYTYHFNSALQHFSRQGRMRHLLSLDYYYRWQSTIDKSSTQKYPDSDWYCARIGGRYQLKFREAEDRLRFGLRLEGNYLNSFSQHPELPILITERTVKTFAVDVGFLTRHQVWKPVALAAQVGRQVTVDDYRDHQSIIFRKSTVGQFRAGVGIELQWDPIHQILLGGQLGDYRVIQPAPRYLPDHVQSAVSIGLAEVRSNYEMELHFRYEFRKAVQGDDNYSLWQTFWVIYLP